MRQLLIRQHLGLGDHLIANAIVRSCAKQFHVLMLCKRQNAISINFMFRDIRNFDTLTVEDDAEANQFTEIARNNSKAVLGLGMFGCGPFDIKRWDQEFYRQAGVEFQSRWNFFLVHRQPDLELRIPKGQYALVHDDPSRGFVIKPEKMKTDLPIVRIEPDKTDCLFDWWGTVENATEIHCIDSCVAIWTDSLPRRTARRFCMHRYARPGGKPPTYRIQWEMID